MSHAADNVAREPERGAKRRRGSPAMFHVRPLLIAAALLGAYGLAYGSRAAIVSAAVLLILSLPVGVVLHTTAGHAREKASRRCG